MLDQRQLSTASPDPNKVILKEAGAAQTSYADLSVDDKEMGLPQDGH